MMVPSSSVLLVITLCCSYNMVKGDAMSSLDDVRRLQTNQTLNFRATYKADFQLLRDFICMAEPPVLQVSCRGKLTILSVSDPSIFCAEMDEPIIRNGTSYQCTNLCSSAGTACTSVYETSLFDALDGPFGSIEFMCEGNEVLQVYAQYTFVSGTDASCSAASTTADARTFHIGRLAVDCLTGSTGSRAYVYDDTYVECKTSGSTTAGGSTDVAEGNEEDVYICLTGQNCRGMSCSIPFDTINFYASLPALLDSCIKSLVPDIPAIQTLAPQVGNFVVQFEASWGQLYDSVASQNFCTSVNPSVLISCGVGTSITFINSTDTTMFCEALSSSELSCSGDVSAIKNSYASVTYTCSGSNLPVSHVTYPEVSASCTSNTLEETVRHAVTLGVLCEDLSTGTSDLFYYYGDLVFECAEAGHNFAYEEVSGSDISRYVCSESTTFGVGSTFSQIVRNVTITTDENWLSDPDQCYNVVPVSTTPTVPVANPPTPSPTITPTTSPSETLSVSPTTSPSMGTVPSMKPLVATVAPVVINSAAPPVVSQENPIEDKGNSIVGIAIGSAVGGVALAAVIGILVFFMKRNQAGSASKPTNESDYTESYTNDDFASPRPPTAMPHNYIGHSATASLVQPSQSSQPPPPLYPVTEVPTNNNNRYANNEVIEPNNKREVFVPPPDMPVPAVRTSITKQSVSSSSSSHRSSYPTNHVVELKDQCRSVAMVRSSSPTFVSPTNADTSTTIPFAVALGVSTTSTMQQPSVTSSTSSRTSKKEPAGRILDDY